jgi:hypothetical protein
MKPCLLLVFFLIFWKRRNRMAHHTLKKSSYTQLVDRINRFPQGAPPSDLLYAILQMLFSEREAGLVALLPIKPFRVEKAAQIWKMSVSQAQKVLDELAGRAILVDTVGVDGRHTYVLPPPMAGFFEFSLMRLRGDIDQKVLSELFYQYMNVEEDFIKALFTEGETQLGRVFVQERALAPEMALHVLDYERASEVISSASHRGVGICYCRHKMSHVDQACDAPQDICMTFNSSAESLIRHGYARAKSMWRKEWICCSRRRIESLSSLAKMCANVNFICNCCGCCCEAMIAARKFGFCSRCIRPTLFPRLMNRSVTAVGNASMSARWRR